MDALKIEGGFDLTGELGVSGSKNAALPVLAATLLCPRPSHLRRVPDLADIQTLSAVLRQLGVKVGADGSGGLHVDASDITSKEAPYELVRTMRASILVLGPLLARFGEARVSLPGGCAIGARPIDQHLKGLERLGAEIEIDHGYVVAKATRLKGTEVLFDFPTVGGTENLMIAAALAEGVTVLRNAAREPEIVDLQAALSSMGVRIEGAGTERITIEGTTAEKLLPMDHDVLADRIEYGTFLVAGALAGKDLVVRGGVADHQGVLIDKLRECGTLFGDAGEGALRVNRAERPTPLRVETAPYPGFPTDMQAQLMTLLALSQGTSVVREKIFENRFMHVAELRRLGAKIRVSGGEAIVDGVARLSGTTVMATDLRASASLVLAGLVADGETRVRRIYHLDRGYEHIEDKLIGVGARVERYRE